MNIINEQNKMGVARSRVAVAVVVVAIVFYRLGSSAWLGLCVVTGFSREPG